jgi:hypothetical protein
MACGGPGRRPRYGLAARGGGQWSTLALVEARVCVAGCIFNHLVVVFSSDIAHCLESSGDKHLVTLTFLDIGILNTNPFFFKV